jgi:MFS family permease
LTPPLDSRRRVGYGDAFASREFRALFGAQLVSISGSSVAAVALTVLVYARTASPVLASLTFALGFLPYVIGGGLLSGIVDRVRPRRLVSTCDLAAGGLTAAMVLPGMPVPGLLALVLVVGTLSSVASGARATLVRATVPEEAYVPARSLMRIAAQCAQLGGNGLGGLLVVAVAPRGTLLLDAASYGLSALTVRFVVRDHANAGEPGGGSLLRDSLSGAGEILRLPELRRLLLVGWLAPMFAVAPEAVAAPYVAAHHGSAALVGWWLVALPVGVILGDVAGVRFLTPRQRDRLLAPFAVAGFLPYLLFALDPSIPIALPLLLAAGACGLYSLGLDGRVRDVVPPHLFARTMTLNTAGLMTLQGLGFVLAGAVAQAVGAATAIVVAGACGLAVTALLLRMELARPTQQRAQPTL